MTLDLRSELMRLSDPKYDEFNRKLIPGIGKSYGVRVPHLRRLAKQIAAEDWQAFLATESTCFEEDMLKSILIPMVRMPATERLAYLRKFVPTIRNWAVCDTLCGKWKMNTTERLLVWDYCLEEIASGEEYRMRFAAVTMMSNYIEDEHIWDILYQVTEHSHEGYYYKMAVAWCLSYCYVMFPYETEEFIFNLEPDVMTMTVQKICDSYRVEPDDKERLKTVKKMLLANRLPRTQSTAGNIRRK